jgi:AraC-like DNA-binding protein
LRPRPARPRRAPSNKCAPEAARLRIEQSQDSLESIARATGFGDAERMRRACLRLFGQPPQAMRRLARLEADGQEPVPSGARG